MPSTAKLLFDLTLTTGLFVGGAWLAAEFSQPAKAGTQAAAIEGVEAVASVSDTSHLVLDVRGVRNSVGKLVVLVFADEDAYRAYDFERAVGYQELQARPEALLVSFPDLKSGPYAITVFHDENQDYDLNMNGDLPLEGYGTSGAKGPYDTPSFQDASVKADKVRMQIYYLN